MNFFGELRYTAPLARKDPGFTLLVIITLALGIGANSALFTVVDAVLLKPLPYRDPDQLVGTILGTVKDSRAVVVGANPIHGP